MLPKNIILIRHGESEGNVALSRSKQGDHSAFENSAFAQKLSSQWRLTKKGQRQAAAAGKWLAENISFPFQRFCVSPYIRAMETAAFLDLNDPRWYVNIYLRERSRGDLSSISKKEEQERYPEMNAVREASRFEWRPPNGESMEDLCLRADRVLSTWARELPDGNVLAVCHGEFMWAMRVRLERLLPHQFDAMNTNKANTIHNCQIMHYTRLKDGEEFGRYCQFRSVNPGPDGPGPLAEWAELERERLSNAQLREIVDRVNLDIPE